jgi:hypothetical protein
MRQSSSRDGSQTIEPDDVSDHFPVWIRFYTERDEEWVKRIIGGFGSMSDVDKTNIFIRNEIYPDAEALFQAKYIPLSEIVDDYDVVLDTNVLLTPFTTGKNSLVQLRKVYERLQKEKRLFVPGQVAREYNELRARKLAELYWSGAAVRSNESRDILKGLKKGVEKREKTRR